MRTIHTSIPWNKMVGISVIQCILLSATLRFARNAEAVRLKKTTRNKSRNYTSHATMAPEDICSPDSDPLNRRVVFYGGTFDPPTAAHYHVAKSALAAPKDSGVPKEDCMWFTPLVHPGYKADKLDLKTRKDILENMLVLDSATESMAVSQAYKKSYYDGLPLENMDHTVYLWLLKTYPNSHFDMLVGADSLTEDGPYTKEAWGDIIRAVTTRSDNVLVVPRVVDGECAVGEAVRYADSLCRMWDVPHKQCPFKWLCMEDTPQWLQEISSSAIRNVIMTAPDDGSVNDTLKDGLVKAGLPDAVVEYFREHPQVLLRYKNRGQPKSVRASSRRANSYTFPSLFLVWFGVMGAV